MPRPTVLVASHYDRQVIAEPLRRLSAWADARDAYRGRCLTREELLDHLPGAHAVIASDEVYDEAILESAGHLTMIARDGTGYDAIDLDAATRLGILVTRAPVLQDATANTTIGLMIALVRKIAVADRDLRDGRWNERDRWLAPDLTGLTLCVVGFGQVGKAVAKRAAALGMEVSTVHLADLALTSNEAGTSDDIDKIVAAADIVSLHLRRSPQTSRIIG
ncbi:MAG: hypothetical protein CMJ18_14985, partial [Phycisphaeraceae bacterium]|nr:hypothetical protein [Phycisphaeraceae bacterium]